VADDEKQPQFFRPGELDDLALLPQAFDMFAREMRDMLRVHVMPAFKRLEKQIEAIENGMRHVDGRLDRLERYVD